MNRFNYTFTLNIEIFVTHRAQFRMQSLCWNPHNYSNYYNIKLYKIVKPSCKLAGGCEILSFLKMCNGVVKI
jgi:hypothetical protein